MRKLAWLMLFAAAALFFSAPENAFAHPNHHPMAQNASISNIEIAVPATEQPQHFAEFVSAAEPQTQTCPHGRSESDCDSCCACSANASVAIATPELTGRELRVQGEGIALAAPYLVQETIFDLSRPPKTFA